LDTNDTQRTKRRTAISVASAIGLAIVASALWDFLFKPGLAAFWSGALSVLTLGSQRVQDGLYADAAMDPTSSPSLFVLGMVSSLPLGMVGFIAGRRRSRIQRAKERTELKDAGLEELIAKKTTLEKQLKIAEIVVLVAGVLVALMFFAANLQTSIAISIWRAYQTNLRIVAPFISPSQRLSLDSRFAGMRTKADYEAISKELRNHATVNKLKLAGDD
jgi:hypothetical protein